MTAQHALLKTLDVNLKPYQGSDLEDRSPVDGDILASLACDTPEIVQDKIQKSHNAFIKWRTIPAPKRGELVRIFGDILRTNKEALGKLVSIECGKILQEGLGEVQEMIDICDFAVGLSRQLYGLTIVSERPEHSMQENWLPLGVVGVISAFNFPVAVWAWNTTLALVCGNAVLWKPSEKTPLTAIACLRLFEKAIEKADIDVPAGLVDITIGRADIGQILVDNPAISLVSATGSTAMGATVGPRVASRFGKCLLELGGNNAVIITPSADMNVALPSLLFGAVGTAGQRCTSTRRAFIHHSIYNETCEQLQKSYASLDDKIGSPLDQHTLVGPLIDEASFNTMQAALEAARAQGGTVYGGVRALTNRFPHAFYATPSFVTIPTQTDIVLHETFAPILYAMPYHTLDEAMQWHNAVPQGLSSAIFTTDIREAEYFKQHSDCGIANVNIGTSGAEIGGAFGGEKETGGGRESGSDAWKNYMRRQTSTTYYGADAPLLAQGVSFNAS